MGQIRPMKKTLFLTGLLFLSFTLLAAELRSPFPSFVNGLNIPNADEVDSDGKIYRGMAPGNLTKELVDFGITDVLIFKRPTKNEVELERQKLVALGMKSSQIYQIPFEWKQFKSLNVACEQTLEALKILIKIKNSSQRKIYFHCTMGEDRTGHLAGLFRLITEKRDLQSVYKDELCAHGFADGNKQKPANVFAYVNGELKTLFLSLAQKIEKGELTESQLNKSSCADLSTTLKSEDFVCL